MFDATREATVLAELLFEVESDINSTPLTLMLVTVVELDPLTVIVVVIVVARRRYSKRLLPGVLPILLLHSS